MKSLFNNRFSIFGLIILIVFSFSLPRTARAFTDAANLVQNTISAIGDTATALSSASLEYKEYVLDPLASGFAKQIIRTMTSDIVNWINSGFQGSPAFIQNPGAFFLDIADQATGEFIAKDGILSSLCSPFSIDIRIALAFKYRPNVQQRYACTLGTIIGNVKVAGQNASINGFTAGDFSQGGWPAFVSLTTEPQNNVYGAYLQAESDLAFQVASFQGEQRDELTQGKGFLSWKKCTSTSNKDQFNEDYNKVIAEGQDSTYKADSNGQLKKCTIETPGSVIAGALETQLGSPIRQLELADELGEIVNALFAQLVTKTLQAGLGGLSSKGSGGGSSYLDQTISDLNTAGTPETEKIRTELIRNLETGKSNTVEYKKNRDEALNLMLDAKSSYDAVITCYTEKLDSGRLSDSKEKRAQEGIDEIDAILETSGITNKTLNLLSLAREADERLKLLQNLQDRANSARTLNDLNSPSQQYTQMLQNKSLTDAIAVVKSKEELAVVQSEAAIYKQDATRKMQECRAL